MRIIMYILTLMIIVIGISFAALNADPVAINYYVGESHLPLSLLLALTLAFGGILGLFVSTWLFLKTKKENFQLKHRVKNAEKELENLRAMPIKDAH